MATFELFTDTAGQFRFRLKANNGEIILTSEGYTTKDNAHNGIASVKVHAPTDSHYERKHTMSGYSFNLRAANNAIIGTSEVYTTSSARDIGIAAVEREAPTAATREM